MLEKNGLTFIPLWVVEQVQARVNRHGYVFPALKNKPSYGRCTELQENDISNVNLSQTMPSTTPYMVYPRMDWISHCYLCIILNNAHHMETRYIFSNCTVNESIRKQISVQQQWAAASAEPECTNQQTLFWRGNIHCVFTLNLEAYGPSLLSIFIVCNMAFLPNIPDFKRVYNIIFRHVVLFLRDYETHI